MCLWKKLACSRLEDLSEVSTFTTLVNVSPAITPCPPELLAHFMKISTHTKNKIKIGGKSDILSSDIQGHCIILSFDLVLNIKGLLSKIFSVQKTNLKSIVTLTINIWSYLHWTE